MSEDIKRYDVELSDSRCDCGNARGVEEVEYKHGDYVRYADHISQLAALREELDGVRQGLEATRIARDAEQYANEELRKRLADAERRNAEIIGWRDPEFIWATIEAVNKVKMQALGHDMSCFSIPLYGSSASPNMTEERREYEVTELAEFMSNLSGGLRHFAGYMIDAGWRKPAALNKPEEDKSFGLSGKALSLIDEEIRNKGLPS